jgi:N-acyl-D-aspartate/D-glutamate deacylase
MIPFFTASWMTPGYSDAPPAIEGSAMQRNVSSVPAHAALRTAIFGFRKIGLDIRNGKVSLAELGSPQQVAQKRLVFTMRDSPWACTDLADARIQ